MVAALHATIGAMSAPANNTTKPWEHVQGEGSAGDPLAARFVASLDYDKRLYKHDIRGSLAHAAMLEKVGLINADELTEIQRGLKEIEDEITEQGEAWPGWKIELEDVHMCIEAALIEKTGDPGRKIHTGRSRNDQVALDLFLWLDTPSGVVAKTNGLIGDLISNFVHLAETQGRIVIPSYTHLQRAQPILVGNELLAWTEAFSRCQSRVCMVYSVSNPLGSGAIAGSALPLDREFICDQIDTENRPSPNSIYATANRDVAIDFVYGLAMTSMWLSRWAEQWIIYATTEFGFITLDAKYTTGSSMMPQKRNPDMLELIRGRCGGVYGHLMALLTMCKGLTIGYNRDLQEDKRHVFAAYDTVSDCLEMAARIVATTTFNEERIKAGLDRGFLDATSLAEYLVTKGVPFRTSHQMVGRLVHACRDRGHHKLAQLTVTEMNDIVAAVAPHANAGLIAQDVYDWLGPENVVKRYRTAGNAGVSGFEEQLKAWKERLSL
jgi:argininosuccinate lyase